MASREEKIELLEGLISSPDVPESAKADARVKLAELKAQKEKPAAETPKKEKTSHKPAAETPKKEKKLKKEKTSHKKHRGAVFEKHAERIAKKRKEKGEPIHKKKVIKAVKKVEKQIKSAPHVPAVKTVYQRIDELASETLSLKPEIAKLEKQAQAEALGKVHHALSALKFESPNFESGGELKEQRSYFDIIFPMGGEEFGRGGGVSGKHPHVHIKKGTTLPSGYQVGKAAHKQGDYSGGKVHVDKGYRVTGGYHTKPAHNKKKQYKKGGLITNTKDKAKAEEMAKEHNGRVVETKNGKFMVYAN